MLITTKKLFLYNLILSIGLIYGFMLNDLDQSNINLQEGFLNFDKLNHNFSIGMGMQSNSLGSTSYYSIGNNLSYDISEKLTFSGNFNLITSSIGSSQFYNSINQPKLNYDLGLQYKINDNSQFQIRIIKNSSHFLNTNF